MQMIAKQLILVGALLSLVGLVMLLADKIPGAGKLPGDFHWHKGNFSFYFPLATCIVFSLLLTVIFNIFGRR